MLSNLSLSGNLKHLALSAAAAVGTIVLAQSLASSWRQRHHKFITLQNGDKAQVMRKTQSVESLYAVIWQYSMARAEMGNIYVISGPITQDIFRQAIINIQRVQPFMQLGLHLFDGEWWYHRFSDAERRIDFRFVQGDRAVFESILEEYMNENRDMNQEDLLWRVLVVSDIESHRHYVSIFMFHCISDGYSRMTFCSDLIKELDSVSKQPTSKIAPSKSITSLPSPSVFDRLISSQQWRRLPLWKRLAPDFIVGIIRMITVSTKSDLPIEGEALPSQRVSKALFKVTPEGLISDFHIVCRQKGVSVSAGLMAAYLAQLRVEFNLPTGQMIKFFVPANLRDRLESKMTSDSTLYQCAIGTPFCSCPIDDDMWKMAKYLADNWFTPEAITDGINHAEMFCRGTVAMVKMLGSKIRSKVLKDPTRRALIGFTNSGVFNSQEKFPRQSGSFCVEEIANCMPTGPMTGFPTFFCTTFHNTAYLSFTYCEPLMSTETAKKVFDGTYDRLIAVVRDIRSDT